MQALNIKRCGKEEVFIDEGAVSRKTNFSYWKKYNNMPTLIFHYISLIVIAIFFLLTIYFALFRSKNKFK